uniref:Uncharacterized protein n=1 Tax=Aplanochytrium stocchinoi TaxID=215587 RepID=A0A7S3PAZ6_9STRA
MNQMRMNLRYHSREVVEKENKSAVPSDFHQHEVLPRGFEQERQAAQKAKLRVSQRIRKQRLQQQQDKERERLERWYNLNPASTSTSKPKIIDGQKVAKSRIKKYQRAQRAKQKKLQKKERNRWYNERIKSDDAQADLEAHDCTRNKIEKNAKQILDHQRREKFIEEKRKAKRELEKQKKIQKVLEEAKENLQKSVKIDLEEMFIKKANSTLQTWTISEPNRKHIWQRGNICL